MARSQNNSALRSLGLQFRELLEQANRVSLIPAIVRSVNKEANSVSVDSLDGYTLPDILLSVTADNPATIAVYPAVGSTVVVGFLEDNPSTASIVQMTQIESISVVWDENNESMLTATIDKGAISCTIGEINFEMSSEGITLTNRNGKLAVGADQRVSVYGAGNNLAAILQQIVVLLTSGLTSPAGPVTLTNPSSGTTLLNTIKQTFA